MYILLKELTWSRQIPNRPVCLRKGNNPLCACRKPFMMRIVSLRTGESGVDVIFFPWEIREDFPRGSWRRPSRVVWMTCQFLRGRFDSTFPFYSLLVLLIGSAQWHVFSQGPKWTKDQAKVDALHTDWLHHVSSAQSVAGINPWTRAMYRPLLFKGARYVFVVVVCVCTCGFCETKDNFCFFLFSSLFMLRSPLSETFITSKFTCSVLWLVSLGQLHQRLELMQSGCTILGSVTN